MPVIAATSKTARSGPWNSGIDVGEVGVGEVVGLGEDESDGLTDCCALAAVVGVEVGVFCEAYVWKA